MIPLQHVEDALHALAKQLLGSAFCENAFRGCSKMCCASTWCDRWTSSPEPQFGIVEVAVLSKRSKSERGNDRSAGHSAAHAQVLLARLYALMLGETAKHRDGQIMTEAINIYYTAKGYFQSCIMIERSPERNTDARRALTVLSMMMTGFSLELYFKAWLLVEGKTSEQVRGYSHRVDDLYHDCRETGLVVDQLDRLVDAVAVQHQDFTYRYIRDDAEIPLLNWSLTFQILDALDNELDALDNEVDEAVGASASYGLQPGH